MRGLAQGTGDQPQEPQEPKNKTGLGYRKKRLPGDFTRGSAGRIIRRDGKPIKSQPQRRREERKMAGRGND